ncbi:metalloproteinase inhibitor 2-like [Scyliorhinus canicula]|uniref:metalloproteinase inhibitor 2-like n=1 Tax=Scyliorhinus canicula TaxID=7830 RepID=UPI0018F55A9F|nr:metalloproteinase inhibitor 2-like [Scyliorhinus canicula]
MSATVSSLVATLFLLLALRVEQFAEACSCAPTHPQQAFCHSDVVIKAKVISSKEVNSGNDLYGYPSHKMAYEIKQIKMFKGPEHDIGHIFTAISSSLCGITLETSGKKEYLITGKLDSDGTMIITLCNFIMQWDLLTPTQRKSLNQRYQMGCDCKIVRCTSTPCDIVNRSECLWTDWVTEQSIYGRQAKHYACVKRSDDTCAWYRGVSQPKREFLDVEDP